MTLYEYYITAFMPLCENMPSGSATKPGDVVTAMNGKTIQVCYSFEIMIFDWLKPHIDFS